MARPIPQPGGTGEDQRSPPLEDTRTVFPNQVLAQSETLLLPPEPPPVDRALTGPKFDRRDWTSLAASVGGLILLILFAWGVTDFEETTGGGQELQSPAAVIIPKATKPERLRPAPPEIPPPPEEILLSPETQSQGIGSGLARPIPQPGGSGEDQRSPPLKETQPTAEDLRKLPALASLPLARGKGYVSVQATPYGTVRLDGGGRRWETPIKRIPVTEGTHTIEVVYEPDGSRLTRRFSVPAGGEIVCIAKFRGGKSLKCGSQK